MPALETNNGALLSRCVIRHDMNLAVCVDARPTTLPVAMPETMFPVKSPVTFLLHPSETSENPPKDVTTPTKSSPVSVMLPQFLR